MWSETVCSYVRKLIFPLFFAIITTCLHFVALQIAIICSCTMLTIISKCRRKVKITQLHQKKMTNVMKRRTANCEFKAPKESNSKKSLNFTQKIILICLVPCFEQHYVIFWGSPLTKRFNWISYRCFHGGSKLMLKCICGVNIYLKFIH